MSLRLCVLGSGSSGNCIYVGAAATHALVDAGLSCRETERRLGAIGVGLAQVGSVCVTHEHEDHGSALAVLSRRTPLALYANAGTVEALEGRQGASGLRWNVFTTGVEFAVGDLVFEPFSVPHDSYDPVGFAVRAAGARIGIVTDIGMPTALVRERLRDYDALVLESNYDEWLLRDAPRPWALKQRIAGRQGHLSNEQAGRLLAEVAGPRLRAVFLAHLSADCNRPELALGTVMKHLREAGRTDVELKLTYPDRPSDVFAC